MLEIQVCILEGPFIYGEDSRSWWIFVAFRMKIYSKVLIHNQQLKRQSFSLVFKFFLSSRSKKILESFYKSVYRKNNFQTHKTLLTLLKNSGLDWKIRISSQCLAIQNFFSISLEMQFNRKLKVLSRYKLEWPHLNSWA